MPYGTARKHENRGSMDLVTCGDLRSDYLITADGEVRLRQMGGNALYSAVGARLWAERVGLLCEVGENYPPQWLEALQGYGFDVRGVVRTSGWKEMRTFYAYTDANTRLDRDPEYHFARVAHPFPDDLIGYSDSLASHRDDSPAPLSTPFGRVPGFINPDTAVHVAPLGLLRQHELVEELSRRGARQITLDPGEFRATSENLELIRGMGRHLTALLPSELEVSLLLPGVEAHDAALELAGWGPRLVLIKRGGRGSLLYDRDAQRFTEIPVYPTRVVDVTGAGDGFCGGFAVGLKQTGDPVIAALMGSVSASFVVEGYGALHALAAARSAARQRLAELREGLPRRPHG